MLQKGEIEIKEKRRKILYKGNKCINKHNLFIVVFQFVHLTQRETQQFSNLNLRFKWNMERKEKEKKEERIKRKTKLCNWAKTFPFSPPPVPTRIWPDLLYRAHSRGTSLRAQLSAASDRFPARAYLWQVAPVCQLFRQRRNRTTRFRCRAPRNVEQTVPLLRCSL
jgi:hypothetical protein